MSASSEPRAASVPTRSAIPILRYLGIATLVGVIVEAQLGSMVIGGPLDLSHLAAHLAGFAVVVVVSGYALVVAARTHRFAATVSAGLTLGSVLLAALGGGIFVLGRQSPAALGMMEIGTGVAVLGTLALVALGGSAGVPVPATPASYQPARP